MFHSLSFYVSSDGGSSSKFSRPGDGDVHGNPKQSQKVIEINQERLEQPNIQVVQYDGKGKRKEKQ